MASSPTSDSKEDLQVVVLQRAVDRFEERVMKPALRAARGEPRVRAAFEHWLPIRSMPPRPYARSTEGPLLCRPLST